MHLLIELYIGRKLEIDCRHEERVICLQAEDISRFCFASLRCKIFIKLQLANRMIAESW